MAMWPCVCGEGEECGGGEGGAEVKEGEVRTCPTCGKTFDKASKLKNHRRRNIQCTVVETVLNFKLLFNVCIVLSPANS